MAHLIVVVSLVSAARVIVAVAFVVAGLPLAGCSGSAIVLGLNVIVAQ